MKVTEIATAFTSFNQGKYIEAYPQLLALAEQNNAQANFTLGFIHEQQLIENASSAKAAVYYTAAAASGNIAAKIRLAYLQETGDKPDPIAAEKLYREVTNAYEQNSAGFDPATIAFAYFRQGVIRECDQKAIAENIFREGVEIAQVTNQDILVYYDKAAALYKTAGTSNTDYAQTLDRIAWLNMPYDLLKSIESEVSELTNSERRFAAAKAAENITKDEIALLTADQLKFRINKATSIEAELEKITKIQQGFKQAEAMGLQRAQLGLLNIDAILHANGYVVAQANVEILRIDPKSKMKIRTSTNEDLLHDNVVKSAKAIAAALLIDPDHLPTLLQVALAESAVVSSESRGLDAIRKVLKLEPYNKQAKKNHEEAIRQHSRYFAANRASDSLVDNGLIKQFVIDVKEKIKLGNQAGATVEAKSLSTRLQNKFYPDAYNKSRWLWQQTYTQANLDQQIDGKIEIALNCIPEILNENDHFKDRYRVEDKKVFIQLISTKLLAVQNDGILKALSNPPLGFPDRSAIDALSTLVASAFTEHYTGAEQVQNLAARQVTIEEASVLAARAKFAARLSDKFRIGRNAFESIASGAASPMPDKLADAKHYLDRGLMVANCPPFSYLGNMLGGSSWLYAGTTFATDLLYAKYKEGVLDGIKQVNTMLPKGRESEDLMQKIAEEFADKYGSQLATMSEVDIEKLSDAAVERMMNYALAQTSAINSLKACIVNHIGNLSDYIIGRDEEVVRVDPEELLRAGLVKGKSQHEDEPIRTRTKGQEFAENWRIGGIFGKSGVRLEDGRIFGDAANIAKYGCIAGTVKDATDRGLAVVDQNTLARELVAALTKQYKECKVITQLAAVVQQESRVEATFKPNTKPLEAEAKLYKTPKLIASIGTALIIAAAVCFFLFPPAAVGLLAAGAALMVGASLMTKSVREHNLNYVPEEPVTARVAVQAKIEQPQLVVEKVLSRDDLSGPLPPAVNDAVFGQKEQARVDIAKVPELGDVANALGNLGVSEQSEHSAVLHGSSHSQGGGLEKL